MVRLGFKCGCVGLLWTVGVYSGHGSQGPKAWERIVCVYPGSVAGGEEKEEEEEEDGWVLRPTGRYAHRREYVVGLLEKVGLGVEVVEEVVGRKDKGEPIPGYLFLARKR